MTGFLSGSAGSGGGNIFGPLAFGGLRRGESGCSYLAGSGFDPRERRGKGHSVGDYLGVLWRGAGGGLSQFERGAQDFFGVVFNYPEAQVKKKRWLGDGPYRVWKNRLRGGAPGVWERDYTNTVAGSGGWVQPEFKGCFANVRWLQLETMEGFITVVPERIPFVQVLTPEPPTGGLTGKTNEILPQSGLGFLHGIPPIGSPFKSADQDSPQGQPNFPAGEYFGSISFYFGKLP